MKLRTLALFFLCYTLFSMPLGQLTVANTIDDKTFPLRKFYPTANTISHQRLADNIANFIIIDVRSEYEFNVLHIANAINIPISNLGFVPALKALRAKDNRDIVFYCNGINCKKSFQADASAQQFNIDRVYTFDFGIFNWAKRHPELSVFFNKSPLDINKLLSKKKFNQHLLTPKDFVNKISSDSLVFDIREPFQRKQAILANLSIPAPLNQSLNIIKLIKQHKSTVFFYDDTGQQVRWLQYLLEQEDIKNYFFMRGGVQAYTKAKLDEYKLDK